jgi:hypothetical protein
MSRAEPAGVCDMKGGNSGLAEGFVEWFIARRRIGLAADSPTLLICEMVARISVGVTVWAGRLDPIRGT